MAQITNRVAVMYAGKLVELSSVREMFTDPMHPYAQALISSLPNLENKGIFRGIPGLAPSLLHLPSGCVFHPRCVHAMDICKTAMPQQTVTPSGRYVYCHLYDKDGNLVNQPQSKPAAVNA
jgi:peptide/nickel transport system ATP-binding protein